MKGTTTIRVAFRNFTRNSRRFILLGLAVTAGFLFLCTTQGLVAGLTFQINTRGARYYGGHVIISRVLDAPGNLTSAEENHIIQKAITSESVHPTVVSRRTRYDTDGFVFFNGESVMTRRIIGMDWSTEGPKIKCLEFVSGSPDEMSDPQGGLISDVTARRLGARVGDQIVVQVNRPGGAVNTFLLSVKAIFHEVSIFGFYTVYMDRGVLNHALGFPAGYAATTGLYIADYRRAGTVGARLKGPLGSHFTAQPVIDFMEEIRTLLSAFTLVSYGILALLAIVVAVGILNLYRVIIYERTREIGTMRAIGMQRGQVRNVILFEALLLAFCSICAGLVLSVLTLSALSLPHLSGAAGLDIFLDRGHLSWMLYPDEIACDAALITFVTLIAAFGPARSAQSVNPVDAIRAA